MSEGRRRWWTEAPGSARAARAASAASIALAVALATGCGSVCDEATEHTEECGFHGSGISAEASCDGRVRCASACAAEAPCGAFDGTDATAFDRYQRCLEDC
ncbi:hypothetical protein [Sorangium sp. So ce124]|uniref:hypothetical protein n=1 Tax=Sorangium sp. So ce124 TaxID=3133280 RepID=UPI003F6188AA